MVAKLLCASILQARKCEYRKSCLFIVLLILTLNLPLLTMSVLWSHCGKWSLLGRGKGGVQRPGEGELVVGQNSSGAGQIFVGGFFLSLLP